MTTTFSIKSVFDALNLDSINGNNWIEYINCFSFNSSKEEETTNGPKRAEEIDSFIKFLLDFPISEELHTISDTSGKQHTTEHNIERFRIHSQRNSDMSSVFPKTVHMPSFAEERELLLAKIRSCYFEAGILCDADAFFSKLVRQHGSIEHPLSLLSDITNHNIDNEHILEGVLHILSNCDYSAIDPFGISIVLAASVNHSPVIQELLISCFESWDAVDGIDILEKLELDIPWLNQYRNEVVSQLKENVVSA